MSSRTIGVLFESGFWFSYAVHGRTGYGFDRADGPACLSRNMWQSPLPELGVEGSSAPRQAGSASAPGSLVEVLAAHAFDNPGRLFLTYLADSERVDHELTFGALDRLARRIAVRLEGAGARPGDRALLLYPSGPEFLAAFLGCLYAHVVAVPAYPPRNPRHLPRIDAILRDADARFVLTVADLERKIGAWLSTRSNVGAWGLACTDEATLPSADGREFTRPEPGALAFLQYTSGSTGQPKGVMVTHANIMANMRVIQRAFGLDAESISITWLPPFHDMGLIGNLLQPIYLGSRVV